MIKVYGIILTYPFANTTFLLFKVNTAFIDVSNQRNCLREINVNRLVFRDILIEFIGIFYRTIFHTGRTTRAFILDNISGLFNQSYFEVSCFPFDTINFGISQDLYIRMPSNLDELRSEYSYGAVVGGKGLIELGHMPADGRRLVDKVHFKTRRS